MTTFGVVLGLGLQAVFTLLLSSFIVITCKKKGTANNTTTAGGRKAASIPHKSRQCNQNSGLLNDDPDLKSNANVKIPATSPTSGDQAPAAGGGNTNTDHQQPRTDLNSNFTSPIVPPEGGGEAPTQTGTGTDGSKNVNGDGQTPSKANQPAPGAPGAPAAPGGSKEQATRPRTALPTPTTPPEQPAA
uniref:Uncharacterized protein n=1 Tax=Panagrellus redivivus TaxID=6233 RepID=A0A7E4VUP4_PANRE